MNEIERRGVIIRLVLVVSTFFLPVFLLLVDGISSFSFPIEHPEIAQNIFPRLKRVHLFFINNFDAAAADRFVLRYSNIFFISLTISIIFGLYGSVVGHKGRRKLRIAFLTAEIAPSAHQYEKNPSVILLACAGAIGLCAALIFILPGGGQIVRKALFAEYGNIAVFFGFFCFVIAGAICLVFDLYKNRDISI